jgi:hypothetical protein
MGHRGRKRQIGLDSGSGDCCKAVSESSRHVGGRNWTIERPPVAGGNGGIPPLRLADADLWTRYPSRLERQSSLPCGRGMHTSRGSELTCPEADGLRPRLGKARTALPRAPSQAVIAANAGAVSRKDEPA